MPAFDSQARNHERTRYDQRRTQRVQIAMPVMICGDGSGPSLEEKTETVSVSAHGCMVRLQAELMAGQPLMIINSQTEERMPCRVAYVGRKVDHKAEIGLEFAEASPKFWRISFPPEDWNPTDRKRHSIAAPRPLPSRLLR